MTVTYTCGQKEVGNQKALIRDFIKAHPEIEVVSEKERNKNLDIRQKVDAAL